MGITVFGVIVVLAGLLIMLIGDMAGMLILLFVMTMLGGAAAITIGSASGSSITPANLAVVFVGARALLAGLRRDGLLLRSIEQNMFLVVFVLYGVISALIMPRLFAGTISVTPLHPIGHAALTAVAPLKFGAQNLTTAIYLLGTMIAGVGAYMGASRPGAPMLFVKVTVIIAIVHAFLGISGVLLQGTAYTSFLELFRNGHYAQLDQSFDGVSRMAGIFPEASGFAGYGSIWFIFLVELWLRDVRPRACSVAALILGGALVASTSSTAYVALAGYGFVMLLRSMILPWSMPLRKGLVIVAALFAGTMLVLTLAAATPRLAASLAHVLAEFTVNKTQSDSGVQRVFWARQGFTSFVASYGLGIGAGSFRSSSNIAAILGSMGVIGALSFVAHLLRAFKPLRLSTYAGATGDDRAIGVAASWTAFLMLIPGAVSAASPDPGLSWAMLCGLALALRPSPDAKRSGYRWEAGVVASGPSIRNI